MGGRREEEGKKEGMKEGREGRGCNETQPVCEAVGFGTLSHLESN